MGRLTVLGAVLVSGCVSPDLAPCGDLLCPSGTSCVGNVCATPEDQAACASMPDGTICASTLGPGRCIEQICVANDCGDGTVTGGEACDGDDIPLTCADLGYYHGDLTCTPYCAIDKAACQGRCGDGVIDVDQGEACDGSVPDSTCVELGRDFGVLGCNAVCGPSLVESCDFFGWRNILPPVLGMEIAAAAANPRGAIALGSIDEQVSARVSWDGQLTSIPAQSYTLVAASSNAFAMAGPDGISWFDGTWHAMEAPAFTPMQIVLDDATVIVMGAGCMFARGELATGAFTSLPVPQGVAQCREVEIADGGDVFVAGGAAGLLRWDGVAWSTVLAMPIQRVIERRAGILAIADAQRVYDVDLAVTPMAATRPRYIGALLSESRFAPGADDEIVFITEGGVFEPQSNVAALGGPVINPNVNFQYWLRSGVMTAQIDPPAFGRGGVGPSADGRILGWGSGVWALGPMGVGRKARHSLEGLELLADGSVVAYGDSIVLYTIEQAIELPWNPSIHGTALAIVGDPTGEHFVAAGPSDTSPIGNIGVYRFDPMTRQYQLESAGAVTRVAGSAADPWRFPSLQRRVNGSWDAVAPPIGCSAIAIATAKSVVILSASCGGQARLFRWADEKWTIVADLPNGATPLREMQDGHVLVGSVELFITDGTTLTDVPNELYVGYASPDDYFTSPRPGVIARGSSEDDGPEIRIPASNILITREHFYYLVDGALYVLPRMPSHHAQDGL